LSECLICKKTVVEDSCSDDLGFLVRTDPISNAVVGLVHTKCAENEGK
jgi:hypothetical protein